MPMSRVFSGDELLGSHARPRAVNAAAPEGRNARLVRAITQMALHKGLDRIGAVQQNAAMQPDDPELSLSERLFRRPVTRTGHWAVWLGVAFFVVFSLWQTWESRYRVARPTFWAEPVPALLIIATAVSGSASGVLSGIALARHERSLLVFATLLVGGLVLLFSLGELFEGH